MANIFAQYAQPVRSIQDYQADEDNRSLRREQLAGAQRQNALAELMANQQRQTMADSQRSNELIRMAYGGGSAGVIDRLRATGDRAAIELADKQETQALGRGKTEAETSKLQAEAQARAAEAKHAAATHLAQRIAMIQTPEDLAAYEAEGIALGVFPQQAQGQAMAKAQQLGGIEQWKALASQSAVPIVERFKADADMARAKLQADTSIKTTGMNNATSLQATGMTNATTRRGQDIGASTAAAGRAQSAEQFAETGRRAEKKDAADRADGGKATEGERNAAGYSSRMTEATKLLDEFEKKGRGTYTTEIAAGVPFVGNAMRTAVSSSDQQQYRQAQEDWVRAKLRKESGASIAADEMEREISSYFPQPGEGPGVIAQKRRARAVATEAMKNASGRAGYTSSVPPTAPAKTASGATASNW